MSTELSAPPAQRDRAPLTFGQEPYAWQLANTSARAAITSSLFLSVRILGSLDVSAFVSALGDLVDRHEALRLSISDEPGGSWSQYARDTPKGRELISLRSVRAVSEKQFTRYATDVLAQDLVAAWDQPDGYPFRFRLLRFTGRHHAFIASFPHLAVDDRSIGLLAADLWRLYGRRLAGAPGAPAPAEPIQFIAAARQQYERFHHRAETSGETYWMRRIPQTPPATQFALPGRGRLGRERPQPRTVRIEGEELRRLKALSSRRNCSPFQYLLAVFAGLVFDLSPQDRIAIHVPVDTRRREESNLPGMFIVNLPVIIDRPDGPVDFLRDVQRELLQALAHRHVHLAALRRAGDAVRAAWGTRPAINLSANLLQRRESAAPAAPRDLALDFGRYTPTLAQVAAGISMTAYAMDRTMEVDFVFNERIFSDDQAASVADDFERRVRAAADDPRPRAEKERRPARPEPGRVPLLDEEGRVIMCLDIQATRAAILRHPAVLEVAVTVAAPAAGRRSVEATIHASRSLPFAELVEHCERAQDLVNFIVAPHRITVVDDEAEERTP